MEERVLMLDLHVHPLEKEMDPKEIWESVEAKKLDAIASTEHADADPKQAFERALEKKPDDKILIPGAELNTDAGHILIYGKNEELYEFSELFKDKVPIETVLDIADKERFHLSVAHPWGFSVDSAAYVLGESKLKRLVETQEIGVEVYNGLLGRAGEYFLDSRLIMKPWNLFAYFEKNSVARKIGLPRLTGRLKKKMDREAFDFYLRCAKPVELAEQAGFITAGSDAHAAARIGSGVLKIKTRKENLNAKKVMKELKNQEVLWSGPFVEEVRPGVLEKPGDKVTKKEIMQGLKYVVKRKVSKKKVKDKIKKVVKRKKSLE
jgi:predicted metal-dependent phosphoesterase TrpH